MGKRKTPKQVIFFIAGNICTIVWFLIGIIFFIILTLPFLKALGHKPNIFIVFFVVLPLMVITGYIFSLLATVMYLIAWKPFLSLQEVKEYILEGFDEHTPGLLNELIKLDNKKMPKFKKYFLFLSPYYTYYKLVILIFPNMLNEIGDASLRDTKGVFDKI